MTNTTTATATATIPGRPVITVVQNDPTVPLDRFADWLTDVELRTVRAWEGEELPQAADAGDGVLVLGGTMSAHDGATHTWLPALGDLLRGAVAMDLPVLGICLGHQILAEALGGTVHVAAPPGRESGVVRVSWRPEAADDPVLGDVVRAGGEAADPAATVSGLRDELGTALVPSMHDDAVVELPENAVWLAHSAMYPFQAFRVGSALGVQFHPEASPELLARWADGGPTDSAEVRAKAEAHDAEVSRVGRVIAGAFAAQVRAGVAAA